MEAWGGQHGMNTMRLSGLCILRAGRRAVLVALLRCSVAAEAVRSILAAPRLCAIHVHASARSIPRHCSDAHVMISTQLAYSSMKLPTASRNLWHLRFCRHALVSVRIRWPEGLSAAMCPAARLDCAQATSCLTCTLREAQQDRRSMPGRGTVRMSAWRVTSRMPRGASAVAWGACNAGGLQAKRSKQTHAPVESIHHVRRFIRVNLRSSHDAYRALAAPTPSKICRSRLSSAGPRYAGTSLRTSLGIAEQHADSSYIVLQTLRRAHTFASKHPDWHVHLNDRMPG